MFNLTTTVSFSKEQVINFAKITGDDGPVHTDNLVVQGGLIVSSLPKILTEVLDRDNLNDGYTHSVSMILEAKFRNKLPAEKTVNIDFIYQDPKSKISKLKWKVHDSGVEYCSGRWVIYKSRT